MLVVSGLKIKTRVDARPVIPVNSSTILLTEELGGRCVSLKTQRPFFVCTFQFGLSYATLVC